MNWLDIVILIPILYGLIRGLFRGLVKEFTAIVAVAAGIVCAKLWAGKLAIRLATIFSWNETVLQVIAYSTIFLVITLTLHIIGILLTKLLHAISLGWVNKLLGAIFGGLKWAIVLAFIVLALSALDTTFHFLKPEATAKSILYQPMQTFANNIWSEFDTWSPTSE